MKNALATTVVWLLAVLAGTAFWTAVVAGAVTLATGAAQAATVAQAAAATSLAALAAMVAVGARAVRNEAPHPSPIAAFASASVGAATAAA